MQCRKPAWVLICTVILCPIQLRLDDSEPRPVLHFQETQLKDGVILSMVFPRNEFDAFGTGYVLESLTTSCYNALPNCTDTEMPLALGPGADLRIRQMIMQHGHILRELLV